MPQFAANLTTLFTEVPFCQRFQAASQAGFRKVEFLFPYAFSPEELAAELQQHQLELALFNMPPGDWDAGERGYAAIPGREEEFRHSVATALRYATALNCTNIHAMSGIVPAGADYQAHVATFLSNMRFAADALQAHGMSLLIEPLNTRDMPGYFVAHQREAVALIKQVERDNVKLQFDVYHAQIMAGDLTILMRDLLPYIGHIQIASVPERHEPDQGEINYPYLFQYLDEIGYQGVVGCEYNPQGETTAGLAWVKPYL